MLQRPGELAGHTRVGINLLESLPAFANNDVSVRGNCGAFPKLVLDALAEAPARKVHGLISGVVQLYPLQIGQIIRRVIEDLINNDLGLPR